MEMNGKGRPWVKGWQLDWTEEAFPWEQVSFIYYISPDPYPPPWHLGY